MSYLTSFEILDEALTETERTELATLGDIFLPNPDMPDLSAGIGHKIERHQEVSIETEIGKIIARHTCRIIQIDAPTMSKSAEVDRLTTWNGQPIPTHFLWQGIQWTEKTADNLPVEHSTRLFRGFTKQEMEEYDRIWEEYISVGSESSIDQAQVPPHGFDVHIRTAEIAGDTGDAIHKHASILAQIGRENPELAILKATQTYYGYSIFGKYMPNQFLDMTKWLVGSAKS